MKDYGLNALVCYDFDNIRYITGTHIGEWNRNKMNRYCILIDEVEQPFLFDPAAPSKRKRVDWLDKTHIMPAVGSMRGAIPVEVGMVEKVADQIAGDLKEYGSNRQSRYGYRGHPADQGLERPQGRNRGRPTGDA
jgi:Xaa-Pro dipeptidase